MRRWWQRQCGGGGGKFSPSDEGCVVGRLGGVKVPAAAPQAKASVFCRMEAEAQGKAVSLSLKL